MCRRNGRWHKLRLEISPLTSPIVIINDRRSVTCPSKCLQRNTKSVAQMLTSLWEPSKQKLRKLNINRIIHSCVQGMFWEDKSQSGVRSAWRCSAGGSQTAVSGSWPAICHAIKSILFSSRDISTIRRVAAGRPGLIPALALAACARHLHSIPIYNDSSSID